MAHAEHVPEILVDGPQGVHRVPAHKEGEEVVRVTFTIIIVDEGEEVVSWSKIPPYTLSEIIFHFVVLLRNLASSLGRLCRFFLRYFNLSHF